MDQKLLRELSARCMGAHERHYGVGSIQGWGRHSIRGGFGDSGEILCDKNRDRDYDIADPHGVEREND